MFVTFILTILFDQIFLIFTLIKYASTASDAL